MVNVDLYCAIITKVSNALNTLVSGVKPGFQALSKGLIVLLCAEVVQQGVPDHGAVHSESVECVRLCVCACVACNLCFAERTIYTQGVLVVCVPVCVECVRLCVCV